MDRDWGNVRIDAPPPKFVYDRGQSHIVYESDGDHCTTVCGRYVRGVPSLKRCSPKCMQCEHGNMRTKVPSWQRQLQLSPLEINLIKTKNPRRMMKRTKYS